MGFLYDRIQDYYRPATRVLSFFNRAPFGCMQLKIIYLSAYTLYIFRFLRKVVAFTFQGSLTDEAGCVFKR